MFLSSPNTSNVNISNTTFIVTKEILHQHQTERRLTCASSKLQKFSHTKAH